MRFLRFVFLCLIAGLVIDGGSVFAQTPTSAPRVVGRIDESQLITLKGNTHPAAIDQNDRGLASPNLAMTDVILVLKRGPEQQAAFDQFVASQYDPSSPNFHNWLAPADVGRMFGPSLADVATISGWLSGHGLHVDELSPDRMTIRFSGSAAQVESTFHVEIHNLTVSGQPHIANMSDPQIPAALALVVEGVKALHNFFPRPLHQTGGLVSLDSSGAGWRRVSGGAQQDTAESVASLPYFGISVGSGSNAYTIEDVAPYDFATIYNLLPLWNSGTDGTGQTIAIAGTSDINAADVASFRSVFGLPAGTAPTTIVANGTDPGECYSTYQGAICTIDDLIENTLDVEWSGAVAKGANIVLVVSGSNSTTTDTVYSSADYVVQNDTASILSVSYGECELGEGNSGNAAYNNLWETAASEGIAVFVAAGDAGAATCDQGLSGNPPHPAQYGLSVSGIASTPYDTAVGGTDLNWGATASPYWAASNNSSNGSNALGYVPEVPWNDTCTNPLALNYLQEWATVLNQNGYAATSPTDAESACNFVSQWWSLIYTHTSPTVDLSPFLDTIGGGGGASNCTVSDGVDVASCADGYTKPAWQSGVPGIPADGVRDLPDVSFMAGNGFLGSAYLMCVSANGSCVTSTSLTTPPEAQEVGGTSVGTPAMAGVMALINQKAGTPQGNPNAELYAQAARQSYGNCSTEFGTTNDGCSFNDIDTGTIAMACAAQSPNCTVLHAGDLGVLSGYSAGTGFDLATGLGSLNIANVVNAWISTIGTANATVTVTPATNSFPASQSVNVTVTVSGASGTPTGNVALMGAGALPLETLSGGTATIAIPSYSLLAGNDTITAHYFGDATYGRASGNASVSVAKINPTLTLTPSLTHVAANQTDTIQVTVSGGGPTPSGTITVSLNSYVSSSYNLYGGGWNAGIPASAFVNGINIISVSYSGDAEYNPGTGNTTVTATILTPTLQVVSSVASLTTSQSVNVTITATGTGPTPTGSVTLYVPGAAYPGGTLSNGNHTFALGPDDLLPGNDTLTVTYDGDNTYLAGSASTSVAVTISPSSISVTPSTTNLTTNNALALVGVVTVPGGTPSGTLTVTGGGYTGYGNFTGSSGQFSFTIPPLSLSLGNDTLTVSFTNSSYYTPSTTSTTVNVTSWVKVAPTVTVTPASGTVDVNDPVNVVVAVGGVGGQGTGTVTLASGSYGSGIYSLSSGSVTIAVPANSLSVGTETLTASYGGDPTYLAGTGTGTVVVSPMTFTISATTSSSIAPGGSFLEPISINSSTGYSGTVSLACALTSQPSGATDLPVCTPVTNEYVNIFQGGNPGGSSVTVYTTAPAAALVRPALPGSGKGTGAGGVVLALIALLGIPARRRNWRSMLGVIVLLALFGGISACGGGGGGGGSGGGGNSGTTPGTYTFNVTATGNPAVAPSPTTVFTVTVN
ncbi:MAG: Ig-like domain repeat protein [Terracidiphilus sp.]